MLLETRTVCLILLTQMSYPTYFSLYTHFPHVSIYMQYGRSIEKSAGKLYFFSDNKDLIRFFMFLFTFTRSRFNSKMSNPICFEFQSLK